MNNIEINQLKNDLKVYLKYTDDQIENLGVLSDIKLHAMKRNIEKVKERNSKSTSDRYARNVIEKKINEIFKANPGLKEKAIIGGGLSQSPPIKKTLPTKPLHVSEHKPKRIKITDNRKPKILFISDVKGWAWWIKSEYLKKYLSDEFDISLVCVVGPGSTPYDKVDQSKYDLYFTYGYSYIDFLYRVPKFKKVTGITAHRDKRVIFPKMKIAGHVHANSMMLLRELHDMGFKNAHYVPNGVDEELFKPITPIKTEGQLVVGHVGKETPLKGQRQFILPAIKKAGVSSSTNLRTYKNKLPHNEMPMLYNQMDVFVVASSEDGTPNPALEAAACGRPIISNKIGNMPEFIKDGYNGFIVPKKVGAYVEKINYFKNNRDELIRMGKNARKTIEKEWTWRKQSEHYRKMFRSIFEK